MNHCMMMVEYYKDLYRYLLRHPDQCTEDDILNTRDAIIWYRCEATENTNDIWF